MAITLISDTAAMLPLRRIHHNLAWPSRPGWGLRFGAFAALHILCGAYNPSQAAQPAAVPAASAPQIFRFQSWTLVCKELKGTKGENFTHGAAETCLYGQTTIPTNLAGTEFSVLLSKDAISPVRTPSKDDDPAAIPSGYELQIFAPYGVNLREGSHVAADGRALGTAELRTCDLEGCKFGAVLSHRDVAEMKDRNILSVRFSKGGDKYLKADFSLEGFTAGMDAWEKPVLRAWTQGAIARLNFSEPYMVIGFQGSEQCAFGHLYRIYKKDEVALKSAEKFSVEIKDIANRADECQRRVAKDPSRQERPLRYEIKFSPFNTRVWDDFAKDDLLIAATKARLNLLNMDPAPR